MKGSEGLKCDPTFLSCNVFCHLFLTNFVLAGKVALYCWLCIEAAGSLFLSFSLCLISSPSLPCFLESAWDSLSLQRRLNYLDIGQSALSPSSNREKINKSARACPFLLPSTAALCNHLRVCHICATDR